MRQIPKTTQGLRVPLNGASRVTHKNLTPVKHPQLCVKTLQKLGVPTLKPQLERCWACGIGSNRVSSYSVDTFG